MSPTAADLAAKRAALAERWVGHGLSPMSEFEMAGAVYRDSLVVGWSTLTIDAYDRRGLLNLVAELLDRLAEGVAASEDDTAGTTAAARLALTDLIRRAAALEPCPYCNGHRCMECRGRGTVGPSFRANRGLPPYVP